MKIFLRLFTVILAVSLMVGLSGFTNGDNNGAGVVEGIHCNLFDGYGNLMPTYESIAVMNHGGNQMITCHASGVPTPGVVWKDSGFLCGTYWGSTHLSWAVVSSEGDSMLKCMIKKPKD